MNKSTKQFKSLVIIIISQIFIITMFMFFSELPAITSECESSELLCNRLDYWSNLFVLRILFYILPAVIAYGFELRNLDKMSIQVLIRKYEIQFKVIMVSTLAYNVLALDILFGFSLFNFSDTFVSLLAIIFAKKYSITMETKLQI